MRIQMVQIGVRDEARLLADYEHCGRELCCRTFIKKLEPVSMKMAKSQKATLDPSKISGRCGRLMCCLRFEDKMYDELKRNLPRKGTRVRTAEGIGHVVNAETLTQLVRVELEGERRSVVVGVEDILERMPKKRECESGKPCGQCGQAGAAKARHDSQEAPRRSAEPQKANDRSRDAKSKDDQAPGHRRGGRRRRSSRSRRSPQAPPTSDSR